MTKKLIVFDLDDTLITGNTWATFNSAMGVSDDDDYRLYKAFTNNEISYQEWLDELHKLYNLAENTHTKEQVLEYLTQYKLAPGAREAVAAIKAAGHDTLLLTGSFQMTADAVAFELGIDGAIANTHCKFTSGGVLEGLQTAGNERDRKVDHLRQYCEQTNRPLADCVVIGDGGNMLGLFAHAQHSVAFESSKDNVKEKASYTIQSLEDLPDLIEKIPYTD